jgi:glycerol-3-phosphate cytidylyltransferase-like family protein
VDINREAEFVLFLLAIGHIEHLVIARVIGKDYIILVAHKRTNL